MKTFLYFIATGQNRSVLAEILKPILLVLSLVYGMCVKCVLWLYRKSIFKKQRLGPKVISVGNITLGGTGKTPLVELIVRLLKEQGVKPAVLTRGYMGSKKATSDEAQQIRDSFPDIPVIVGANRYQKAQEFLKDHAADVFVMDDGFQHWRLWRDLDIVAVNANNPWGNGYLIPRGIMREPLDSLKRSALVVLTKVQPSLDLSEIKKQIAAIHSHVAIVEADHRPKDLRSLRTGTAVELSLLQSKRIGSVCSIADPDSFHASLKMLGADVLKSFSFMDHHVYQKEDISALNDFCRSHQVDAVITTQKDEGKLKPFLSQFADNVDIWVLRIQIELLNGKDVLCDRILSTVKR